MSRPPHELVHLAQWTGPDLWTLPQASKRLAISTDTLRRHVEAGTIRAVDIGTGAHRDLRFLDSDLDRFVTSRTYQPHLTSVRPTANNHKAGEDAAGGYAARRAARQRGARR